MGHAGTSIWGFLCAAGEGGAWLHLQNSPHMQLFCIPVCPRVAPNLETAKYVPGESSPEHWELRSPGREILTEMNKNIT